MNSVKIRLLNVFEAIQILTDRMNGGHKAVVKTELQSTLVIRQSVHQYVSTENEPEYYI